MPRPRGWGRSRCGRSACPAPPACSVRHRRGLWSPPAAALPVPSQLYPSHRRRCRLLHRRQSHSSSSSSPRLPSGQGQVCVLCAPGAGEGVPGAVRGMWRRHGQLAVAHALADRGQLLPTQAGVPATCSLPALQPAAAHPQCTAPHAAAAVAILSSVGAYNMKIKAQNQVWGEVVCGSLRSYVCRQDSFAGSRRWQAASCVRWGGASVAHKALPLQA